jgi:hypothetical protein
MATVKIGTVIMDGAVPRDDADRCEVLLAYCEQNGLLTRHIRAYESELDSLANRSDDSAYQELSEMVDSLTDELNRLLPDNMCAEWDAGDLIVVGC